MAAVLFGGCTGDGSSEGPDAEVVAERLAVEGARVRDRTDEIREADEEAGMLSQATTQVEEGIGALVTVWETDEARAEAHGWLVSGSNVSGWVLVDCGRILVRLTPDVPGGLGSVPEEIRAALADEFGPCEDAGGAAE